MGNILVVRNIAQKILFEEELKGQLSDGFWEGARPSNHWKPWCDAEVIVDPNEVGRNFYAQRDTYNFANKELLDIVGPRMASAVFERTGQHYSMTDLRKDLRDLKAIVRTRNEYTKEGAAKTKQEREAERLRSRIEDLRRSIVKMSEQGVATKNHIVEKLESDASYGLGWIGGHARDIHLGVFANHILKLEHQLIGEGTEPQEAIVVAFHRIVMREREALLRNYYRASSTSQWSNANEEEKREAASHLVQLYTTYGVEPKEVQS